MFFMPGEVLAAHRMLPAHAVHLLLSRLSDEVLERELLEEVNRQDKDGVNWDAAVDPEAAQSMYWYEPAEDIRQGSLSQACRSRG